MGMIPMETRHTHFVRHDGLTLIELLVSLTIVSILVGLLLVGVQHSRESGRRIKCTSNLHQTGLAIEQFVAARNYFPPGATENGYGFLASVLPYMDPATANRLNFSIPINSPSNDQFRSHLPAIFVCPSDSRIQSGGAAWAATNYAGNSGTGVQRYGYNGLFRHVQAWSARFPEGKLCPADVRDGLSNTVAVSEILPGVGSDFRLRTIYSTPALSAPNQLDVFASSCATVVASINDDYWSRGRPLIQGDLSLTLYNHVLGPNQPSCTNGTSVQFGAFSSASDHRGIVNVLFADGHVQPVAQSIDLNAWRSIGSRDGGETAVAF